MTGDPAATPPVDAVARRARTTPQRTALLDAESGESWTYRAYDRRANVLADGLLEAHGLDRGERVAVLARPEPNFGALVFATARTGTTLVPLPTTETAPELATKLDRVAPGLVVATEETASLARSAVDEVAESPAIVTLSELERTGGPSRSAGPHGGSPQERTVRDPENVRVLLFTSGTSGTPKVVQLTDENLQASATASAYRLGVCPDDRWLCCLPVYHMGGLAPFVRSAVYGTTVVVQSTFDPTETARTIEEAGVTGVSLVPTMLTRLLEADWEAPESLRFVLLGGAAASEDLLERCRRADVPIYPTYGMTETASQIATARPADVAARPGTVGQPLSCTTVTVVEHGEPVGPNETGELVVSGPTVTPGYLDPDATDAAFGEYGFHTGDVGYRDADGYLWVLGRRSDRIVTGGENVDPTEVRETLESHPAVRQAAVVGLDDPEWGERVAALVVPDHPSEPPAVTDLLAHCAGRLAGYKRPKTVGFAASLPRTASGTIDRDAVRERLERDGQPVR